jgi:hypothetical protein
MSGPILGNTQVSIGGIDLTSSLDIDPSTVFLGAPDPSTKLDRLCEKREALSDSLARYSAGQVWSSVNSGAFGGAITHVSLHTGTTDRKLMNVTTRVVRVKAGWLGQIVVNGSIVWESTPRKSEDKAGRAAYRRVEAKTAALFA